MSMDPSDNRRRPDRVSRADEERRTAKGPGAKQPVAGDRGNPKEPGAQKEGVVK